ncbi:MAG: H-NS histone family protein [Prosthecobacter sp.]|nr:H-NS histone family protein [Prosthecobacter sp.]
MTAADIVAAFKLLRIEQQTSTYEQITAAFSAAKDARRLQLEAEIRSLGFKPGEGKRKPERAAKYRGPNGEVWSGVGAMASWLRKFKEAGEDIERYRV